MFPMKLCSLFAHLLVVRTLLRCGSTKGDQPNSYSLGVSYNRLLNSYSNRAHNINTLYHRHRTRVRPSLENVLKIQFQNCKPTSIVVIWDDAFFKDSILRFMAQFDIPVLDANADTADVQEFVRTAYVQFDVRYFIVSAAYPGEVIHAANRAFLREFRGQLSIFVHRTKWLVLTWTYGFEMANRRGRFRRIQLDHVTTIRVHPHSLAATPNPRSNISPSLHMRVDSIRTLVWLSGRIRDLADLKLTNHHCDLFPNKKYGFNGRNLKVLVKNYFEAIIHINNSVDNTSHGDVNPKGLLFDLFHFTAQTLNFTYEFVRMADRSQSFVSWSNYLSFLNNRSADIGLSPWSLLYATSNKFTASYPFLFGDIVGVYRKPKRSAIYDSLFFLCPFPSIIYLFLFSTTIYLATLYLIISNLVYKSETSEELRFLLFNNDCAHRRVPEEKKPKCIPSKKKSSKLLKKYLLTIYAFIGAILNQGILPRPKQMSSRLVVGIWALGLVAHSATFSSYITAERIKQTENLPFKTFKQLLKRSDYHCSTVENSLVDQLVNASKSGIMFELQSKIKHRLTIMDYSNIDKDLNRHLKHLAGDEVFIFYGFIIQHWLLLSGKSDDYVIMSSDPLMKSDLAVVFPYQSDLTRAVSKAFIRLHENGMKTELYRSSVRRLTRDVAGNVPKKKDSLKIELIHLVWLPIVCGILLFLSAIALAGECIVYRRVTTQ